MMCECMSSIRLVISLDVYGHAMNLLISLVVYGHAIVLLISLDVYGQAMILLISLDVYGYAMILVISLDVYGHAMILLQIVVMMTIIFIVFFLRALFISLTFSLKRCHISSGSIIYFDACVTA